MLRGTGRDHGYAGVRRAPEHFTFTFTLLMTPHGHALSPPAPAPRHRLLPRRRPLCRPAAEASVAPPELPIRLDLRTRWIDHPSARPLVQGCTRAPGGCRGMANGGPGSVGGLDVHWKGALCPRGGAEFCLRGRGGCGGGQKTLSLSEAFFFTWNNETIQNNKTDRNSPVPVNQQMPYSIAERGFQAFFEHL